MNSPSFDQPDSAPADNLSSTGFLTLSNDNCDDRHIPPHAGEVEFDPTYIEHYELKPARLPKGLGPKKLSPLCKKFDLSVHHAIEQDFNSKDKKQRRRVKHYF